MDPSAIPAPVSINKILTVGEIPRNPTPTKLPPPPASFSAIPRARRALGTAREGFEGRFKGVADSLLVDGGGGGHGVQEAGGAGRRGSRSGTEERRR